MNPLIIAYLATLPAEALALGFTTCQLWQNRARIGAALNRKG